MILTGYRSYGNLIKWDFFHAVAVSILLYGCITQTKSMETKIAGNYMLFWTNHGSNSSQNSSCIGTYLSNHSSKMNKTCGALLEKQGPTKEKEEIIKIKFIQCPYWAASRDGWQESQGTLCYQCNLMKVSLFYGNFSWNFYVFVFLIVTKISYFALLVYFIIKWNLFFFQCENANLHEIIGWSPFFPLFFMRQKYFFVSDSIYVEWYQVRNIKFEQKTFQLFYKTFFLPHTHIQKE